MAAKRCPITGATAAAGSSGHGLRTYAACIAGAGLLGGAIAAWWWHQHRAASPKKGEDESSKSVFSDPNDPRDDEGRVHHLHVKEGDVADRILSVGDTARAERISKLMDGGKASRVIVAPRGFVTYTGTYKGVPVSIVATMMGIANMDFVVRETRAVVPRGSPLAIIRYGTCGGLHGTPTGTVVVASKGSVVIRRDPDLVTQAVAAAAASASSAASGGAGAMPAPAAPAHIYSVSAPILPDASLSSVYFAKMSEAIGASFGSRFAVMEGINATADSFYGSQGRTTRCFEDHNASLVADVEASLPDVRSMEMESGHLFDLARTARADCPIYASAAAMVIANRHGNSVLSKAELAGLEEAGGRAALETLSSFAFLASV